MPLDLIFEEVPPPDSGALVFGDIPDTPSGNPLDLLFSETPAPAGPVHLVFGSDGGTEPSTPDVEVYGEATITGFPVVFEVVQGHQVSGAMTLTGVRTVGSVVYDINVLRLTTSDTRTSWLPGTPKTKEGGSPWETSSTQRVQTSEDWKKGLPLFTSTSEGMESLQTQRTQDNLHWETATPVETSKLAKFSILHRERVAPMIPWAEGLGAFTSSKNSHKVLKPLLDQKNLLWEEAKYLSTKTRMPSGKGASRNSQKRIPWEIGRPPPPGRSPGVIPPDIDPPDYTPTTHLLFECPFIIHSGLNVPLLFGMTTCGGEEVNPEVPVRKVYFIVNSLHLTRVEDGEEIETLSASVGIDKSSWAWSFSGSIAYHEFEKIEPTSSGPVEVELRINDIKWRMLVEEYDRNETFGKTVISIKGRSVTAQLGAPYAPVRSFVQNSSLFSRQFAEAELVRPGMITGFELDWMFPDELGWQMPTGTWSYNQLSPIDVINQLVQGAGGYVNSHPELKRLIVRPEYQTGFWDWPSETPDLYLPRALIRSQNLKWTEKPLYNGVYVSGENTGVTALVRKLGTLGDFQAPAYVSPMISDNIAARMKGLAILSSGGKQASVGLEMPMEQSVGLITPGMLIEVVSAGVGPATPAWRGQITSTNIDASWSDTLKVSQSVEVERHYGGF